MVVGCRTYLMGTILLLEEKHIIMDANLLPDTLPLTQGMTREGGNDGDIIKRSVF